MIESEVAHATDKLLIDARWEVFKTSQHKSVGKGMRGFTDRVAVRDNVTLFIEYKGEGGKLRDSQVKFEQRVRPHCGRNLYHWVIFHPRQLPPWVTT